MILKLPLLDLSKKSFWKKIGVGITSKRQKIGVVKITENNLCVTYNKNTIHYEIDTISFLEIHGDLYREFSVLDFDLSQESAKLKHSGITEFIFTIENKKIKTNFLISTKTEFNKLHDILKIWYKNKKFKIREYDSYDNRMLLLNPYLSYEKIQKTKKELGIESMYE